VIPYEIVMVSLPLPFSSYSYYLLLQGDLSAFSSARLKASRPSGFYAALLLSTGLF
jgi:hypothetical protein